MTRKKPATLEQAKARWSNHTRRCLNDHALAAAKESTVWSITETGFPMVTLGGLYEIRFCVSESGNVFAQQ